MRQNYETVLAAVLKHEGGYVDHPKDPGGATNMGITHKVLAQWRKITPYTRLDKSEVKNLTLTEAAAIYRKNYWDAIRGDDLPSGVDYATFDFAVNSGVSRASKALQRIVKAKVDGQIGPETLAKAAEYEEAEVVAVMCDERLAWLQNLTTWPTFGKGWASRVAGVKRLGIQLAKDSPVETSNPAVEPPKPIPEVIEPTTPVATGFQPDWGKIGIAAVIILALGWGVIKLFGG